MEPWSIFANRLFTEEGNLFRKMLNEGYKYSIATNDKDEPFPTESLIMTLLLSQQKMIGLLISYTHLRKQRMKEEFKFQGSNATLQVS